VFDPTGRTLRALPSLKVLVTDGGRETLRQ